MNAEANSTVFVSFVKNNGQLSTVSGFTNNDLEVTGGQVSGFYEHNATHYRFYVVADKKPQRIKIRIPVGSAKDDGNFPHLLPLPGFNISADYRS